MPRPSSRNTIIQTATTLFSQHGFHATGVDLIIKQAKISKKTLYTYFRSKDELIIAVLQHYDSMFRNSFMKQVEKRATHPQDKLLAVFDAAHALFIEDNFFGCLFIKAIGEYSDAGLPLRQVSKNFKHQIRAYIKELCDQAGAKHADELADELALLLEGAIVTAQVSNKTGAARIAKSAATKIINANFENKNSNNLKLAEPLPA